MSSKSSLIFLALFLSLFQLFVFLTDPFTSTSYCTCPNHFKRFFTSSPQYLQLLYPFYGFVLNSTSHSMPTHPSNHSHLHYSRPSTVILSKSYLTLRVHLDHIISRNRFLFLPPTFVLWVTSCWIHPLLWDMDPSYMNYPLGVISFSSSFKVSLVVSFVLKLHSMHTVLLRLSKSCDFNSCLHLSNSGYTPTLVSFIKKLWTSNNLVLLKATWCYYKAKKMCK